MKRIYRILMIVRPPLGVTIDVERPEAPTKIDELNCDIRKQAIDTFFKKHTDGGNCEIQGFGETFTAHVCKDDLDVELDVEDVTAEYLEAELTSTKKRLVELTALIENLSRSGPLSQP